MQERRRHPRMRFLFMDFQAFWNRMVLGRMLGRRRGRTRWATR